MVVPAPVRDAADIDEGTVLIMFATPDGLVLLTRDQLRREVRDDLAGVDLVASLLDDRRRAARQEDAA